MAVKKQGALRQISVHIEEPKSGAFEWVLSEAGDPDVGTWTPFQRARKPANTYKAAMADGLVALESMIDDLDNGPRSSTSHDTHPEPDRAMKRERAKRGARATPSKDPSEDSAGRNRTAFGFGLML